MIVDLPYAPLAVLAFLGTCISIIALATLTVVTAASGHRAVAARLSKALLGIVGVYLFLLFGASALSKEKMLGRGVEKHFCEIDCHLAYSVVNVERSDAIQGIAGPRNADRYLVVSLRTRFDERSIGANRGNGLLRPNPREVLVIDGNGKHYLPVTHIGTPMTQSLGPGESYETKLVFDVAPGEVKLFVKNQPWPNALLIGHENSPFHGKAYFDLKG